MISSSLNQNRHKVATNTHKVCLREDFISVMGVGEPQSLESNSGRETEAQRKESRENPKFPKVRKVGGISFLPENDIQTGPKRGLLPPIGIVLQ